MKIEEMSLETRLESLRLRHTFGANGPEKFLIHPEDYAYLLDRHGEELKKWGLTFRGVPFEADIRVEKGYPKAVVGFPAHQE